MLLADCSDICTDTSRDKQVGEEDGENYFFVGLEKMMKDIANNKFLEYGQLGENMYGTTYDSIREVIRSSRMCILDISPQVFMATLCLTKSSSCVWANEHYCNTHWHGTIAWVNSNTYIAIGAARLWCISRPQYLGRDCQWLSNNVFLCECIWPVHMEV